ncbi:MAG: hypothetical protein Pg6C_11220 [Treponemataceae bacterium]|nr:MAG: hypothetical protein Pg6C_11220 [Treponemataceae bacterium]
MAGSRGRAAVLPLVLAFIFAGARPAFPAGGEKIPLLISDHHAEHAPFMLKHLGTEPENRVCMVVIDAHTDTVKNTAPPAGNHNWISPLYPFPLASLVWINAVTGFLSGGASRGFYFSVSEWGSGDPPLNARAASLAEFPHIDWSVTAGQSLFVSIDLDFFTIENNTPADIPFVFGTLFDFASKWQGKVVWALALSRAWLPDDEYAWEVLRQSLRWLCGKTEFAPPEITLFTTQFEDTSAMARSWRQRGLPMPSFYGKEGETPGDIREMLEKLNPPAK